MKGKRYLTFSVRCDADEDAMFVSSLCLSDEAVAQLLDAPKGQRLDRGEVESSVEEKLVKGHAQQTPSKRFT